MTKGVINIFATTQPPSYSFRMVQLTPLHTFFECGSVVYKLYTITLLKVIAYGGDYWDIFV